MYYIERTVNMFCLFYIFQKLPKGSTKNGNTERNAVTLKSDTARALKVAAALVTTPSLKTNVSTERFSYIIIISDTTFITLFDTLV